jgi:hypothetical protein
MKYLPFAFTPIMLFSLALLVGGGARADSSGEPGFNTAPDTAAPENTVNGKSALSSNTTGTFNTANGGYTLQYNSTGSQNTANGRCALENNLTGSENTATGYVALNFNTTGYANTASGSFALNANTTGYSNTADGSYALNTNTIGYSNAAVGRAALYSNTAGSQNTANGFYSLYYNTTGSHNTADGNRALNYNTTGEDNIAVGYEAGYKIATGSSNIEIGNQGDGDDAATIRLGTQAAQTRTFVAGIFGTTATGGSAVYITPTGQLGTLTSSAKFKRNIHDMGDVSDALLSLRPVTFQYKTDIDPTGTPQFGLIAEEVEKVNPDLVVHDAEHQIYSVRYEAVNAMLLHEFQKQHAILAEQARTMAEQARVIAAQQNHAKAQDKVLQSLASRLEQLEQAGAKSR